MSSVARGIFAAPETGRPRIAGLILLLCLSGTGMAQDGVITDHRHLQDSCAACHGESFNVAQLTKTGAGHCAQCHGTAGVIRIAAVGTEKAGAAIEIDTGEEEFAMPEKKLPPTFGMRYPLYYDESKYGDEPHEMVPIPAGEFIMGTDERLPDEGPQLAVTLPAFYIDKYEVTNLQYRKFSNETKRRSPMHFRNRTFPPGKADHPVTYVSWYDAEAYCEWAGKRLPTDREWEKAARGTDGRTFAWGNEFRLEAANTPVRWKAAGMDGDTTPVGAFEAGVSPYGVYDMSGNVWEWTSSWYKQYPGNTRETENYGERYKTLKGGSWFDCSFYKCGISSPVYNRSFFALKVKNDTFGFRCAKDASQTAERNN